MDNIIVDRFDYKRISQGEGIPIICVYRHPADYPTQYVARLWRMRRPEKVIALADTLEQIRMAKPPEMVILNRGENDDPCIVETWI